MYHCSICVNFVPARQAWHHAEKKGPELSIIYLLIPGLFLLVCSPTMKWPTRRDGGRVSLGLLPEPGLSWGQDDTESVVVVPVVRRVVVAFGGPTVPAVVVPTATAKHAVGAPFGAAAKFRQPPIGARTVQAPERPI